MSGFACNFINPYVCFDRLTMPTVHYKVSNCPSQSKIGDIWPIIVHNFVLDPQPFSFTAHPLFLRVLPTKILRFWKLHDFSFPKHFPCKSNFKCNSQCLATCNCAGGFRTCWTVAPGYSLTVLSRRHGHKKRKGGQVRFSAQQTSTLERQFNEHKYLSPEERRHLAAQLKLSDRQVKISIK